MARSSKDIYADITRVQRQLDEADRKLGAMWRVHPERKRQIDKLIALECELPVPYGC